MKRITINDVARAAGVSRQTVSRAMNDKGEISPETKERVLTAVRELGYQPNRAAQSMVTRRTRTIGLIFSDILNPFFPEVIRGIQDIARENDYNVFLCNTDDQPEIEDKTLNSLVANGVDGIIILGSSLPDEKLSRFADNFHPLVITNRFVNHPNINLIIVDNIRGGALAASHFIEHHHTAVGAITNENQPFGEVRRMQGFRDTLAQYNLPSDNSIIASGAATISGGYSATKRLLAQAPHLTGIFTYNDLMGLGAIRACHDLGLNIPQDVAIIGFDDIHLTSIVSPSLTSIRVDKYAMGSKAINRLLEMLENPLKDYPNIEMPVELIVREST